VLPASRLVWFLASLAAAVAVVACTSNSPLHAGEYCWSDDPDEHLPPCQPGTACIGAGPSGVVCTAATACKADSDCPGNFGCVIHDYQYSATSGPTYCATDCTGGGSGSHGCAAGSACAADGVGCESRLGLSCYVTDTNGTGCGNYAECSATTRVCTLQPPCTSDSDCGGYHCAPYNMAGVMVHKCDLFCAPPVVPPTNVVTPYTGLPCGAGSVCDPQTFTCSSTLGDPCDPASDNGGQCGRGAACSPASRTCVAATRCNTDADCGDYACFGDYCLQTCTQNMLACAVGKTCDLLAHICS
jgi:hypothetical protein